ncbi:hypothetical protein KY336_03105 [Candidatus Woesearchaeota archaeon]|nr:hypothetical protein [Candidatus Woesearchaeota archaeon]
MLSSLAQRMSNACKEEGNDATARHYNNLARKAMRTALEHIEHEKSHRGFTKNDVGGLIDDAGDISFINYPSDVDPANSFFSPGLRAFTEALLKN